MRYRFCPMCGQPYNRDAVEDPNRLHCESCGYVFYQNPIVGVAVVLLENRRILLGRRKGSYKGLWCIPCGYVEYDEEVHEAAIREFREETGLVAEDLSIYRVYSNFHNRRQHTVGLWFTGKRASGAEKAGDDLTEVGWFSSEDLPPLAFPTDRRVLHDLQKDGLL